jgi:hypothetical protein
MYSIRRWWRKAQQPEYTTQSKVLKRLKNLQLFEGKISIEMDADLKIFDLDGFY